LDVWNRGVRGAWKLKRGLEGNLSKRIKNLAFFQTGYSHTFGLKNTLFKDTFHLTWLWCSRNAWCVMTDGQTCPIFLIYTEDDRADASLPWSQLKNLPNNWEREKKRGAAAKKGLERIEKKDKVGWNVLFFHYKMY